MSPKVMVQPKPNDRDMVLGGNKENPNYHLGTHKHEGVQKEKGPGGNVHQEQAPLPQGQIIFSQGNL